MTISRITMAAIAGLVLVAAGNVLGQPPVPEPDPDLIRLPITAKLHGLATGPVGDKAVGAEFVARAGNRGFLGRADGKINVEIVNRRGDAPVSAGIIEAAGGEIDAVWGGQTSAWIDPRRAVALAETLPTGYLLRHASLAWDNNEGPVTVGSDSYITPGPGGQGIKVGIIDRNFVGLTAAEISGDVPVATRYDFGSGGFESGTIVHGVAHLETVFDHAPLAEYFLFRIATSTHLGAAVDTAISLGINVLSATQSFYNEGWADDTGAAALAAKKAGDNGILYVSSSGNRALDHWQGDFVPYLGGNWLDWSGGDYRNSLGSIGNNSSVTIYLQWDTDAGAADYNLYLYDMNDNLLATSVSGGTTFEEISWTNNTGAALSVYVAVILNSGPAVELEVFERTAPQFQYAVAAGSLTSPNNNTSPNCLVIGAVPFDDYADGNLKDYSSRGPTNSGARGIDLIGPTDTTTLAYNGSYGGTSCATPNVAGTAVALWSTVPQYNAMGMRILLQNLALAYNDWGAAGPDPDYGYGGVRLPVYAANTQWVDPRAANQGATVTLPWYTITHALFFGGNPRLLLLGGVPQPDPIVLNQPATLKAIADDTVIGASQ